jgi:hypothetical protein
VVKSSDQKTNMLTPNELAGIAIYSDSLVEIEAAIGLCVKTLDEDLFSVCAEAIGHVARRFKILDERNFTSLMVGAENHFQRSASVHDAIYDMFFDLEKFLKSSSPKRPLHFQVEFKKLRE